MPKYNANQIMQDIVYLKNQLDGLNILLSRKKSLMAKYFEKSGQKNLSNDDCVLYVQERPDITYDIQAIKQALDPQLYNQFIDTDYSINNWKRFTNLCKQHGISGQNIKPYIFVKSTVNQQKLSKLYEKGDVSLLDLEGCYTAEVKKSVALRMKDVEREIPIAQPD